MLSVKRCFREDSVGTNIACPTKLISPCKPTDTGMQISTFAGIEVSSIMEKVPFYCADESAFGLFEVNISELKSRISDKWSSKSFFNVLEISSSSKIAERRG